MKRIYIYNDIGRSVVLFECNKALLAQQNFLDRTIDLKYVAILNSCIGEKKSSVAQIVKPGW